MYIRRSFWRTLAVLCMALLVTGCASRSIDSSSIHSSSAGGDYIGMSTPIVLKDTSPGQFAPTVSLMLGGYIPATRDSATLGISFEIKGQAIQFVGNERMTCNGTAMQRFGGNFEATLSLAAIAGQLVTCTYISGHTSATLTFTAPIAPAILSPQDNAQVPRSANTLVSYRAAQDAPFYIIALGPTKKAWTPTAANQPNPVILDTSAFLPGSGFIALTQTFTLSDFRWTGFQSVSGAGGAQEQIAVTWV